MTIAPATEGADFETVAGVVFAEPYRELPRYRVDAALLGPGGDGPDNRFRADAIRTLGSRADLLEFPQGQKLLQPNGICFSGEWRMSDGSPYTGLLAAGSRTPAIVRVSVSLSETTRDARRAFGMAVKLFPPAVDGTAPPTGNLFLLDSVAGTRRRHALDAVMDNEPPLGSLPGLASLGLALRLRADLNAADRAAGAARPDYAYRPVDHLAAVGADSATRSPRWLRLSADPGLPRVDAEDFRDELDLARYPAGRQRWRIEAADAIAGGKSRAAWQAIGELLLTRSIVSPGCDRRLHFAHPRLPADP